MVVVASEEIINVFIIQEVVSYFKLGLVMGGISIFYEFLKKYYEIGVARIVYRIS